MRKIKIAHIVGARPQFIKLAPVSRAIKQFSSEAKGFTLQEEIIHSGQHYEEKMSQIFFNELQIPRPDYNLEVGAGPHGAQTGRMLERLEHVLLSSKPDWVLVYGDTNTTLAGALAAVKLHIPVAHVEAGLRSFVKTMPEEVNRVLTDHVSSLLLAPTPASVINLKREGLTQGVKLVGDVMYDATLHNYELAKKKSAVLQQLGLQSKQYYLLTVHRALNTDNAENLLNILRALDQLELPVVFPVHPRTQKVIERLVTEYRLKFRSDSPVRLIEPVGYLDMLLLESQACKILTDSGGVQKEAYFFKVPCVTLREETEWVETVECGWNTLVGTDIQRILAAARANIHIEEHPPCYGDGHAAGKIARFLVEYLT